MVVVVTKVVTAGTRGSEFLGWCRKGKMFFVFSPLRSVRVLGEERGAWPVWGQGEGRSKATSIR